MSGDILPAVVLRPGEGERMAVCVLRDGTPSLLEFEIAAIATEEGTGVEHPLVACCGHAFLMDGLRGHLEAQRYIVVDHAILEPGQPLTASVAARMRRYAEGLRAFRALEGSAVVN
jgi:hypothetical protein